MFNKNQSENIELRRSRRSGIVDKIAITVSILSLAISTASFFQSRHSVSTDMEAKAKASDSNAQFFLATYYYEINDLNNSLYWYKIASLAPDDISFYAKNNLAVIYLLLDENGNTAQYSYATPEMTQFLNDNKLEHYKKIVNLFKEAFAHGVDTAGVNLYAYFQQMPEAYFSKINYKEEKEQLYGELVKRGYSDQLDELTLSQYSYSATVKSENPLYNDESHKYVLIKVDIGIRDDKVEENDPLYRHTYTYDVYEKKDDQKYTYQFCNPD